MPRRLALLKMAEHNQVSLYASVISEPKVYMDDETGEYIRASFFVNTLRSSRPYQGRDESNELTPDTLMIMSQDPVVVKQVAGVNLYDILIINGVITTRNMKKMIMCPNEACESRGPSGQGRFPMNLASEKSKSESSMVTFISPITIDIRHHNISKEESSAYLIQYREMSNIATMVGNLCGDVQMVENGHAAAYQIGIDRKFYLKGDDATTRADYPYVRVYGDQAEKDFKYLHKGSMVLIDGMVQLRSFERKFKCPYCGEEITKSSNVMEIVPYSTEYLQDFITKSEYERMQEERHKQLVADAVAGTGIGMDVPDENEETENPEDYNYEE